MKDSPKLSKKDVEHVAILARLALTDEEVTKFTSELDQALQMAAALNDVNTNNLAETAHVTGLTNVMRADKTASQLTVEESLANAPSQDSKYFKVPKIL